MSQSADVSTTGRPPITCLRIAWAAAASIVAATGCMVLVGWAFGVARLKSVLPGFVSMKANTAVGLVLAGLALVMLGRADRSVRHRWGLWVLAGATALVGILNIIQYLFGLDLGIDQLLFREPAGTVGTLAPGRMAPATAIDFFLAGSALVLAGFRRLIVIAQRLALLSGLVGLLALTGYLYGAPNLYGIGHYTQMAVHTASCFVILSVGILLAHPADGLMRTVTSDTMGRWLLRRLAPLAVVVPLVLGWLRVEGEEHGYFEGEFGVALMMMVLVVILVSMIWWTSRALSRMDTARRQVEVKLRESDKRFMDVLYASHDAILLIDGEKFVDCNEATALMLGYSNRGEFLMTHPSELSPPTQPDGRSSFEKANEMMQTAFTQGFHRFEWLHRRASGEDFPVEVSLTPIAYQGKTVLHCLWRDITAQKRAEEQLRDSREFLDKIINCIRDPIFVMDDRHRYILMNDTGCALSGRSRESILGRTTRDLFPPEIAEPLLAKNEKVLATGLDDVTEEHLVDTQGRQLTVLTKKSLYVGRSGERHVVGIVRDITDRKQAEEEVRLAKVAAEQANAAKSTFLANMSHEIRTPMTAIIGFAEMIDTSIECCTTCPEHKTCATRVQNRDGIQVIRRNGMHLLGLINNILDLSKVEAGKIEVERVPCSPVRAVEEAVSLMRVKAVEKGLSLDARYEFPLPETMLSDSVKVRQVLVNLMGNAVKFTTKGRVEIVVRCTADAQAGRGVMAFTVKDTGIGMTDEQIGRLFQPFAQADSSTTRQYGGTGLGLAISQKLAEALGGDIQVVSRPGEGSTFTFTLATELPTPVRMLNDISEVAARAPHQPQPAWPAALGLAGTILLAEDGPDNQKLISLILRKAGAKVDVAPNGRVAVERAMAALSAGKPYDAILMDMQMPEVDGYKATGQLRKAGYDKPIIALTAHAMAGDRRKCLNAGCDDYATKPVDRAALLSTLARLMSISQLGPEEAIPAANPRTPASDEAIYSTFRGDADMAGIIAEFVGHLPLRLVDMREAAANNHWDQVQRGAHQLKGAGGSYGYACLTDAARELESHAKRHDAEAAVLVVTNLAKLCERIQAGLAAESQSQNVSKP